ncbi:hypothetical protein ACQP00_20290 [Dactylosporangium sp. CS-047395]|uniref:hypothetical protein n=1 Tax=Dactylosporangium sp. CS-047395 TaxID=3239936 RepID=UPI003D8ED01B
MPTSPLRPIQLPAGFWLRADVAAALIARDISTLFQILRRHGCSQRQIGAAVDISQSHISLIMRGERRVATHDVLTRIGNGLNMPDHARTQLGLSITQRASDIQPHASYTIHNVPSTMDVERPGADPSIVDASSPAMNRLDRIRSESAPAIGMLRTTLADTSSLARPSRDFRDGAAGLPSDPAQSGFEEDGHEVRRRDFMRVLTGLTVGTPPLVRLEALRQSIGHTMGAEGDVWNSIADDYAYAFYTTRYDILGEQLAADLSIVQQLLISHPDDRDLTRAGASLSMIMAIVLTSTGQTWMARRWWRTARQAADKSGDMGIRVMTRSQETVKGLYDGRPLANVLALADETIELAGKRVCPGLAGVLAGRAQALAISGRPDEAEQAVNALSRLTDRMPDSALIDDSMFGWPEHRLRHTESFVYTEIGATGRAMDAQDRALRLYTDNQAGNRAMVQMHRVSCLIQKRHLDDGVRYAAGVLDALPVIKHDQLLYEVARRAVAAVPDKEQGRAEIDQLRDRISTLPNQGASA